MMIQEQKQEEKPQLTIELLHKLNELDTRAYNLCKTNGFTHIDELIDYYLEHGTFKKLRNCGSISNLALINICKRHSSNRTNTMRLDVGALTFDRFDRAKQALESGYIDALVLVNRTRSVLQDSQTITGNLGICFNSSIDH